MKCLSVKNPYGYLICYGIKSVENRTWKTDYRGELYIHTTGEERTAILGEGFFPKKLHDLYKEFELSQNKDDEKFKTIKNILKLNEDTRSFYNKDDFFFKKGFIIGKVNLVDILKNSKDYYADNDCYNWILENPVLFERKNWIQSKGSLKLFDV